MSGLKGTQTTQARNPFTNPRVSAKWEENWGNSPWCQKHQRAPFVLPLPLDCSGRSTNWVLYPLAKAIPVCPRPAAVPSVALRIPHGLHPFQPQLWALSQLTPSSPLGLLQFQLPAHQPRWPQCCLPLGLPTALAPVQRVPWTSCRPLPFKLQHWASAWLASRTPYGLSLPQLQLLPRRSQSSLPLKPHSLHMLQLKLWVPRTSHSLRPLQLLSQA